MRTILNLADLDATRAAAIAATFALAATLGGCGDGVDHREAPQQAADNDWTVEQEDGAEPVRLVEGRGKCIDTLVAMGKSQSEANRVCDESTPGSSGSGAHAHGGGGGGSAAHWYLIGRDSGRVAAYSGHPSTGLSRVGGIFDGAKSYFSPHGATRTATASTGSVGRATFGATSRGGFVSGARAGGFSMGG